MSERRACVECLRRSWLLALLGPYLEKIATGAVGPRSPELLRLGNEDLVAVVGAEGRGAAARPGRGARRAALDEELVAAGCWACCRHDDLYPLGCATPPTRPGR